jgi:hypothetical protein
MPRVVRARAGQHHRVDENAIAALLALQRGVISRRQVLAAGGVDHEIARLLRRRIWARVHDGVYVDHTGKPSWQQRAWAAVIYYWPAVLDGASALTAYGVRATGTMGWGRLLDPCRLAAAVGRILMARGWAGTPRPCRPGCAAAGVCADVPPSAA